MNPYAYQCSQCKQLVDAGEYCYCRVGIDARQRGRKKGDAELCREHFEPLEREQIWHEPFYWERY